MNKTGLVAGRTETTLTDEGRLQAKAAGQHAKSLDIDCIVSSPMSRALDTARIIAEQIGYPEDKILVNKLTVERDFGALEGQPWVLGKYLGDIKGIEPADHIINRARQTLDWLNTLDANNILVVSHGSFGRALRSLLTDIPFDDHSIRTSNAEIQQWL
jgi:uncharacterized phosphatase